MKPSSSALRDNKENLRKSIFPPKSFFFVRHGESEANKLEIMCGGGVDTPLTDVGVQQAVAARLAFEALSHRPDVVCYSDLLRASKTASIINEVLGLPSISHEGLREHHMGDWEGQHWREVIPRLEKGEDPENGESFPEFRKRIQGSLVSILNKHTSPLIVSHGGFWHSLAFLHGYKSTQWPVNGKLYFFKSKETADAFPWDILSYQYEDEHLSEIKENHLLVPL